MVHDAMARMRRRGRPIHRPPAMRMLRAVGSGRREPRLRADSGSTEACAGDFKDHFARGGGFGDG